MCVYACVRVHACVQACVCTCCLSMCVRVSVRVRPRHTEKACIAGGCLGGFAHEPLAQCLRRVCSRRPCMRQANHACSALKATYTAVPAGCGYAVGGPCVVEDGVLGVYMVCPTACRHLLHAYTCTLMHACPHACNTRWCSPRVQLEHARFPAPVEAWPYSPGI